MTALSSNFPFTLFILFICLHYTLPAPSVPRNSASTDNNNSTNETINKKDETPTTTPPAVELKSAHKIHIWPHDPLQQALLLGLFFIVVLFIVLFVIYIVLAFVSPERLDMLDFRPAIDEDLDRSQNVCAILVYWWYCCFICGINALMLMAARKIAEVFTGNNEVSK